MESTILIAKDWDDAFIQEVQPTEFHQFHHRYVALDPGVTDLCATLFAFYDFQNRTLHVTSELTHSGPELNSQVLSTAIKERLQEQGDLPIYRFVADNNNPHLLQDLNAIYNLPFYGTSKTRLESTQEGRQEGMVNKLNNWLRQGRILVHPSCTQLIGCLRYGTWKQVGENKRRFDHSKVYGHYDHLAALVYLVRNVDEFTNPVPTTYGFTQSTFNAIPVAPSPELQKLGSALLGKR